MSKSFIQFSVIFFLRSNWNTFTNLNFTFSILPLVRCSMPQISLNIPEYIIPWQRIFIYMYVYALDAVGSRQIILPMPNLERPYKSDKGSEAVLKWLQYKRCAEPQKVLKLMFTKMLTEISAPKIKIWYKE